MQKQFKPVDRPGTILDERTLQLIGTAGQNQKLNRSGNPMLPTLKLAIKDNKPEFRIYTNDTTDTKNNGVINVLLDAESLDAILDFIEDIGLSSDKNKEYIIEHHARTWTSQGLSEKPFKVATTRIAMDDLGVFLQVAVKGRPAPKFYIKTNENLKPGIRENGEVRPMTPLEYAKAYSKGYARRISSLIYILLKENYISWQEQQQRKQERKNAGGNGGQWNKPQQQSQGTPSQPSAPPMDMDDDIPF